MVNYNYLNDLNEAQREAVEYIDGPSFVIAGAGAGKTRVITYKVVHLLSLGVEPWRILALTFTNKAAREMKDRISSLTGPEVADRLWMGTFHSIFLRILRRHADLIGYRNGFTIYDANDSKSLIKMIIKDFGLDDKVYKVSTVASIISNAKNFMQSPMQYEQENYEEDRKHKRPMISRIYETYVSRCQAANAMDFDDILVYMNLLLRDNPDIAAKYREQFRFILVDEYQDTNFSQQLVVKQLADNPARICMVGDDAQSIYSFRGANFGQLMTLEKVFPGLRTFKLGQNYRSTQNIVNAAGSLISKNTRQIKKTVFSRNEEGEPVEIIRAYSDLEEAATVALSIEQSKLTEHDSFDDYAILYRTNAQSRVLEEALRKRSMPYRIVGGMAFFQRKEIKDMICYFRLAVNPDDDEALRRVINYPARGIGETTLKKLFAAAAEAGTSIWKVICDPDNFNLKVNSGTLKKLDTFHDLIQVFIDDNKTSDAFELGQLIFNRTGILTLLAHDKTPESISRQENLGELLNGLRAFTEQQSLEDGGDVSMSAFLSQVSLATDADEKDQQAGPKVTMMTVHAAKGLEFKHVYIVGLEEELFPSAMAMSSLTEIEEERRLMYVAITRACKTCVISYAKSRYQNGQPKMNNPSRFLRDIDPQYVVMKSPDDLTGTRSSFVDPTPGYNRYNSNSYRKSSSPDYKGYGAKPSAKFRKVSEAGNAVAQHSSGELRPGMRIEHAKLGIGTITDIGAVSNEPAITVDFGMMGVKKLLLKFAKFEILDK